MSSASVKKGNACVPCHERKVKCDAGVAGIPCSRCVSKDRVQSCVLVSRRPRQGGQKAPELNQTRVNQLSAHTTQQPVRQSSIRSPPSSRTQINTPSSRGLPTPRQASLEYTPYDVSEEDAQIQTLHRMADESTVTNLSGLSNQTGAARHHVEYVDRLNSVSILCEALGYRQPKRLIQVELPGSNYTTAKEREMVDLDPTDIGYLESKRVFDPPPMQCCVSLLRIYFECIHPYCPILDRVKFYEEFRNETLSHFLLFAILANVVPYASIESLEQAGYANKITAQHDFFLKAQLLHDFGCERSQLIILQGSIVLSTFHYHFAPAKDHRVWFHNAVRLATQLGLHRQKLGNDLDPATHKLCRRAWWLLFSRDVLFSLSGFGNARAINDEESDTVFLSEGDWVEENISEQASIMLPPVTTLQKHFFIQNCQLALLGAKFLRLSRTTKVPVTSATILQYADEMSNWRSQLPKELSPTPLHSWSRDNVWIIVLLALSYRLECVFYRFSRDTMLQKGDENTGSWCRQQFWGCVFELDTLMSRAVVHDLVQYCPSSLIVCACNLLAFHIEIGLDPTASALQKITAKARIHVMLEYLKDISSSWRMAKWIYRVSEWVVRRAGLMFKDEVGGKDNAGTGHQMGTDGIADQLNGDDKVPDMYNFDEAAFGSTEAFPEHWIQDFLGESFFAQLDDDLFNLHTSGV